MEDSLKVENTLAHHHGKHNVSGATQASFLAKVKATRIKLGQKKHRHSVPKILCAPRHIIKHKQQIKTAIK